MDWSLLVDAGNNIVNTWANIYRDRVNRDWQEKMWHMQNEYNSPVEQRKRLEEAGINPNLAFGSSASSGMASNPPSTPSTHEVKMNLGEFYLRKKQVEAQIKAQEASVRREDEVTEQLRMNNLVMSQLLNDRVATERGDLYVQRIIQGWKEENIRHSLDVGLQSDEQKLDCIKAEEALTWARKDYSEQALENLKQTYEHLVHKYGYEDNYYDSNMNPYETSTPIGIIRYIIGTMKYVLEKGAYPSIF